MTEQEARALAMALELHRQLRELYDLPEHGPGSCVAFAWDCMNDVIGYLEPDDPDEKSTVRSPALDFDNRAVLTMTRGPRSRLHKQP